MKWVFAAITIVAIIRASIDEEDYDDYRAPHTCLTPGCGDENSRQNPDIGIHKGVRVVQLLSGDEHSKMKTARPEQQQLFAMARQVVYQRMFKSLAYALLPPTTLQMQNYIYLIGDAASNEVAVVDGCWDPEGIDRYATEQGLKIVAYIATHHHWDHIGSVERGIPGMAYFIDKLGLPGYIHRVERESAIKATVLKGSDRLNAVEDGFKLNMGTIKLTFMHTPGHSPGSMTIQMNDSNGAPVSLVTGDTLFPGSCGRVDLEDSDKKDMYHSLQHVLARQPEDMVVWPGHGYGGANSTIGREKQAGFLRTMTLSYWMNMMSR